jgi:penicillin-binding protein 2
MFRPEEQRPMTSQFAVRVAVISGMALVAFTVIFFRLWYVQVLSGEEYRAEAENNRIREFTIQAPRGEILDKDGRRLVENRTALSLQVRPDQLPENTRKRNTLLKDLARIAPISYEKIKREIRRQSAELPASPVTLARDVDQELVYHLRERQDQFPGIAAEEVTVREYPQDSLAAHLFGFVAEINPDQLDEPQYEGLNPGDQIGGAGVEKTYDSALRGRNGAIQVPVDASGNPRGRQVSEVTPERGNNLLLTIDAKVQAAGEQAIAGFGKPAAFVVMNVNDGAILGMGSYPTFDPGIYTPPVSFEKIEALTNAENDPLFNKAMQSEYPTGSTFKAITGTATLEEGLATPSTVISDTGTFEYGGREWTNAGGAVYGPVSMVDALRVSSDIYFYREGIEAEKVHKESGKNVFQDWASKLGFGSATGIDLPGEASGLVPTPEWRNKLYEQFTKPDSECGREVVFDPARDCYETVDRPWTDGDNMNLAVGQGDLQATPLQLAVAYATIANGGSVVRPHVAQEVQNPLGQTEETFTPAPRRELDISDETLATIREGLRQAAMEPGGTSAALFGNYPREIAGKTGTAERGNGRPDQSWYAAFAPFEAPEIVAVATIDGGGFGSDAAAPAVREILNQYFGLKGKQLQQANQTGGGADAVE